MEDKVIDMTTLPEDDDTALETLGDAIVYELLRTKLVEAAGEFKTEHHPDAEWTPKDWADVTYAIIKAATKQILPPLGYPENDALLNRVLKVIGQKGNKLARNVVLAAVVVPPGEDSKDTPSVVFVKEGETKH